MASPSKVIKHGLLDYPSIFPDVGEVLHQLFCEQLMHSAKRI